MFNYQQIAEPQLDTTKNIWEWYFKVRVPYQQTRSVEEIRLFGTPVSGHKGYDNELPNQWMTTMMTIDQMVDLYQKGVPVKVCDIADTKLIYEYISDHIHAWKQRLERGINIGDAPINDLIDMDQFANIVYEHAKYQFTRETADSIMSRYMTNLQRFNGNSFLNPAVIDKLDDGSSIPGIIRINNEPNEIQDRESLSDFFKDRLISIANRRRW